MTNNIRKWIDGGEEENYQFLIDYDIIEDKMADK